MRYPRRVKSRLLHIGESKLLRIGAAAAMFELGLFVVGYLIWWIVTRPGDRDFGSIYSAAFVGIHYGWSHIYDAGFTNPVEAANHLDGFAVFPNPPPVAWLAVPFALLPWRWAALIWQALLLAALISAALLTAPARRWDRTLILLSVLGFQPVLIALGYGTLSPLVLLLLIGTLRALEGEAPVMAGVMLGLTALKPQLTLLVVPILLAAGYWKTALSAVGVAAALAVASVVVVGANGTRDYIAYVTTPDVLNHPMPYTVKGLVGVGPPSFIATGVVVVAMIAIAIRFRPRPDTTLALGILASLFVAQHLNYGDFVLWLLPVWLAFRAGQPMWLRAVAALTWMTGWLVIAIPLVALAAEAALAVAFVVVIAQARPVAPRAPARAAELASTPN